MAGVGAAPGLTKARPAETGSDPWLDDVLDAGSWRSWDDEAPEAVRTGTGALAGRRVAVIVSEFGYLGGSVGVVAAARIVAAVDRARREGLALIAGLASGGTRMQDAAAALLAMPEVVRAILGLRDAGLPYLVHLRHPCTGGVLASLGSLGDDTSAEPGALVGLLGPTVARALGSPLPEGVQRSESLVRAGLIDAVVDPAGFRARAAALLDCWPRREAVSGRCDTAVGRVVRFPRLRDAAAAADRTAPWSVVAASRGEHRASATELLAGIEDPLLCADTETVLAAWGRIGAGPALFVMQRRGRPVGPSALRLVRRLIGVADRRGVPVVSVIDTTGPEITAQAEGSGLAREVASTLAAFASLTVPSVALLLGEGSGAGAIALAGTDLIVAARGAWLAPLPPEGAAAILYRDETLAPAAAERQRVAAAQLYADGLIDGVVLDAPVLSTAATAHPAGGLAAAVLELAARVAR